LPISVQTRVSEVNYDGRKIYAGFIHDWANKKKMKNTKKLCLPFRRACRTKTKTLNDTIRAWRNQRKSKRHFRERKETQYLEKIDFINGFTWVPYPLSTAHLSASLIEKYAEPLETPILLNMPEKSLVLWPI
jgi:hypothetical protein